MMNMLRKVKGRPMPSESQPQNKRPAPLKMPMTLTSSAAITAPTAVNFCANGEATEISAAPAVTFNASISHRTYHLGRRKASTMYNHAWHDLSAAGLKVSSRQGHSPPELCGKIVPQ